MIIRGLFIVGASVAFSAGTLSQAHKIEKFITGVTAMQNRAADAWTAPSIRDRLDQFRAPAACQAQHRSLFNAGGGVVQAGRQALECIQAQISELEK